jgi:hypothetical protein
MKPPCKVKESHNRTGVAQKVPGGLGSQIFMTFGTWWWDCQPHALAAFTSKNVPGTHLYYGLSRPQGHGAVGRKYVTEKSSDRNLHAACSVCLYYCTAQNSRSRTSHSDCTILRLYNPFIFKRNCTSSYFWSTPFLLFVLKGSVETCNMQNSGSTAYRLVA